MHDDPWAHLPERPLHTDHTDLLKGPFSDGPSVTKACLSCHENAAGEVAHTVHFTWQAPPAPAPGRAEPVALGKKNALNNFCIGIQSNWPSCTSCHAGYGWTDASYDFSDSTKVDCLVCHDRSGTYAKTKGGLPAEGVDLLAAARSVGSPGRDNCGSCHFSGGGGNAVKHGDLDETLLHPAERRDVHMGRYGFVCTDCHRTEQHVIAGRAMSVSVDDAGGAACTDCHAQAPHGDARLDGHTGAVACQTCHIPEMAVDEATKMHWDWSQAGQDLPEDVHTYMKIKGRFVYEQGLHPVYRWSDGTADHYLAGDRMDPDDVTEMSAPRGNIDDPRAKIWPFKLHTGLQPYDTAYRHLLQPKTAGEGGFWMDFDWDQAFRLGAEASGIAYSGSYGFARTAMYWPTTHMVAPKEQALQCVDCHGPNGRLDWKALGYEGDPLVSGSRMTGARTVAEHPIPEERP